MLKDNSFLGKEKISKLLFQMSMPATIGMLVMTLYNVVDSIFIGHFVGSLGLAAVTIIFPFMMLIIATAMGYGVGASSIISRKFGEKKEKDAQKTFGNFIFLILITSIVVSIISYFFIDEILFLFGSSQTIMPLAKAYFSIILMGMFFQMFSASINNIIRAEGAAKTAMFVMLIGAILNIILDFIFIYFLNWGIEGAAYATILSQFFSFLFSIYFFIFGKSLLKLNFKFLIPNFKVIREICTIGFSSFARQSSMSLIGIIMNNSLRIYGGDLIIAAYGIVYRLVMVLIMPAMGILQGSQPIIGYNYGAKKLNRVKDVLSLSIKSSTLIIISIYIFLMLFPQFFISMFTKDIELINLTISITRIFLLMMPFIGYQFIIGGYFQSVGKARPALVVSLLRQFILLIPLVLILPLYLGLNGIWYAYPIADFFGFVITWLVMRREYNNLS